MKKIAVLATLMYLPSILLNCNNIIPQSISQPVPSNIWSTNANQVITITPFSPILTATPTSTPTYSFPLSPSCAPLSPVPFNVKSTCAPISPSQKDLFIDKLTDKGDFAIVWKNQGYSDNNGIYFQKYTGDKAEPLIKVDTPSVNASQPVILSDKDNNLTLVWTSTETIENSKSINVIYAQRFDNQGKALTPKFIVASGENVTTFGQGYAVMNNQGEFVIIWRNKDNFYFRRYNAQGLSSPVNEFFTVSSINFFSIFQVAINDNGNFVINLTDYNETKKYYTVIQQYNNQGMKVNERTLVLDTSFSTSKLAIDNSDNALIILHEYSKNNIISYDKDGNIRQFPDLIKGELPDIKAINNEFLFVQSQGYASNSVIVNRYDAYMNKTAKNFLLNIPDSTNSLYPFIATDNIGNFLLVPRNTNTYEKSIMIYKYNSENNLVKKYNFPILDKDLNKQ